MKRKQRPDEQQEKQFAEFEAQAQRVIIDNLRKVIKLKDELISEYKKQTALLKEQNAHLKEIINKYQEAEAADKFMQNVTNNYNYGNNQE